MRLLVKATAAVIGLARGDVAYVDDTPTVDALIEQGYLLWLDAPEIEPEPEVTPVVKARKAKKKDEDGEREGAEDAGAEEVVSFLPAHPFEDAVLHVESRPDGLGD